MEKETAKRGKTSSHIRKTSTLSVRGKPKSDTTNRKRLSDWHRLIRENTRIRITPMEYISSEFSFNNMWKQPLSFKDMSELARFLNTILNYLSSQYKSYDYMLSKDSTAYDSVESYLYCASREITERTGGESQIEIIDLKISFDKNKLQSLYTRIIHSLSLPEVYYFDVNYAKMFRIEGEMIFDEQDAITVFIMANELLSSRLLYQTEFDLDEVSQYETSLTVQENYELLQKVLKIDIPDFSDSDDEEELYMNFMNDFLDDDQIYAFEMIKYVIDNNYGGSIEELTKDHEKLSDFRGKRDSLCLRVNSCLNDDKKNTRHLSAFIVKKLTETINEIQNRDDATPYAQKLIPVLSLMKETILITDSLNQITNEFQSQDVKNGNFGETLVSEYVQEFRDSAYLMLEPSELECIGLASKEVRYNNGGEGDPLDSIIIKEATFLKMPDKEVVVDVYYNEIGTELRIKLENILVERNIFLNKITKLNG